MRRVIGWLRSEDNRGAALALLTLVTALLTGGWFLYDRLAPRGPAAKSESSTQTVKIGGNAGDVQQVAAGGVAVKAGAGAVVAIGYTIEQHEAALARREDQLRGDLERAHAAETDGLLAQLDEVRRQRADEQGSFEARKAELTRTMAKLDEVAFGLPEARLESARGALAEGDTAKADAIFAEVEELEAAAVDRAATAAFERGKLAEADVRWTDAAEHYATAARLAPSYGTLFKAQEYAWRSGDYAAALRLGDDLIAAAVAEYGEGGAEHAAALNGYGLALMDLGRNQEARQFLEQAVAIGETLDPDGPEQAIRLNNLGTVLRRQRSYNEAEQLFLRAIAIGEATLRPADPEQAKRFNNLGELYLGAGRFDEVEAPLKRAVEMLRNSVGSDQPDLVVSLSNLGQYYWAVRRYGEAERAYRCAIDIGEKYLPGDHPSLVKVRRNLDDLRVRTGLPVSTIALCEPEASQ